MRLLGSDEDCFVRFSGQKGILLVDEFGYALVTERPRVPVPILRNLVLEDGKPITDPGGGYQENSPPPFDTLLVSNREGDWNRIAGQKSQVQRLVWDGCKFIFKPDKDTLTLEDFMFVGPSDGFCNTYEVVLRDQGDGTVRFGYRDKPSMPPGSIMFWGGPATNLIAEGWVICEGQAANRATYPDLFAAWGYVHGGAGDTFYFPGPQGRYIRIVDDGAGIDPNADTRTAAQSGGNTGDNVGSLGKGANAQTTAYDLGLFMMAFAGCIVESP